MEQSYLQELVRSPEYPYSEVLDQVAYQNALVAGLDSSSRRARVAAPLINSFRGHMLPSVDRV